MVQSPILFKSVLNKTSDDRGPDSGSAYVFDTTTGSELFKLTASDATSLAFFGASVAIDGTTATIGAPHDTGVAYQSGSAYIFDTSSGQQLLKLVASDAAQGDEFGLSVAISGNTAVVGAPFDDDAGPDSGSAYVFNADTGEQLFKLSASDAAAGDEFGHSVAISGTTAVVGAPFQSNGVFASGAAYVFDTITGEQLFKLVASDAIATGFLGYSVDVSKGMAIAGAFGDDDGGFVSGSAYVFDTATGEQILKLTASDAAQGDQFGFSVAISSGTAVAGANMDDDAGNSSGSAYVFKLCMCQADWNADGSIGIGDFTAYITDFNNQDPASDIAAPFGSVNFFDIVEFINQFDAGCP